MIPPISSSILYWRREGATNSAAAHIMLFSLAVSFVVMAEPAPTDLAFIIAATLIILGGRVCLSRDAIIYIALGFFFIISNTISAVSCLGLTQCGRYFFITLYLMLIPLAMVHFTIRFGSNFLNKMYAAILLSVFISALVGILARAGVMPGPTDLFFRRGDGLRLSPFFKDPNVYAPFLGFGLMVYLGHVIEGRKALATGIFGLCLIWTPLFLAFSRGAWLATGVSIAFYVLFLMLLPGRRNDFMRFRTVALGSIILVVPVSLVLLTQFDLWWFFENRLGIQKYDSERFSGHSAAVYIAFDNPLGLGPGRFIGRTNMPGSEFALAAHNVYLKVVVENGFLGLFSFLLLHFFVIVRILQVGREQNPRRSIQLALIAALIGTMVNGYFIDTLHWRHLFVLFGFILCELHRHDLEKNKRCSKIPPPAPAAPALTS